MGKGKREEGEVDDEGNSQLTYDPWFQNILST